MQLHAVECKAGSLIELVKRKQPQGGFPAKLPTEPHQRFNNRKQAATTTVTRTTTLFRELTEFGTSTFTVSDALTSTTTVTKIIKTLPVTTTTTTSYAETISTTVKAFPTTTATYYIVDGVVNVTNVSTVTVEEPVATTTVPIISTTTLTTTIDRLQITNTVTETETSGVTTVYSYDVTTLVEYSDITTVTVNCYPTCDNNLPCQLGQGQVAVYKYTGNQNGPLFPPPNISCQKGSIQSDNPACPPDFLFIDFETFEDSPSCDPVAEPLDAVIQIGPQYERDPNGSSANSYIAFLVNSSDPSNPGPQFLQATSFYVPPGTTCQFDVCYCFNPVNLLVDYPGVCPYPSTNNLTEKAMRAKQLRKQSPKL